MTLLIVLILLQVISSRNVEKRAKESINAYLGGSVLSSDVQYDPSIIELPDGYKEGDSLLFYTDVEKEIIKWTFAHKPEKATKVRIESRTYYVGINQINGNDLSSMIVTLVGDEGLMASRSRNIKLRKLDVMKVKEERTKYQLNTSHELKTPLTSIRGYAEGIEKGIITDYKKTGKVITKETEKMSHLIEEILLSAKLESGAMQLRKETIFLNEFVEECLMPMEGAVLSRGLNVELSLNQHKVSADPDRLEQAISNLITNAIKYAKSRLAIKLDNGLLTIQNDCDQISDNDLNHLFDRFYTGEKGNTGIGLSLAKEIIELHGWKINAGRTADGIVFAVKLS